MKGTYLLQMALIILLRFASLHCYRFSQMLGENNLTNSCYVGRVSSLAEEFEVAQVQPAV